MGTTPERGLSQRTLSRTPESAPHRRQRSRTPPSGQQRPAPAATGGHSRGRKAAPPPAPAKGPAPPRAKRAPVEAMAEMLKVDGDKLTARLRAAMKEETAAQGDLDQLQMDYGLGATENPGFLRELADKAEAHARRCEEIAVYARLKARELEQRRAS